MSLQETNHRVDNKNKPPVFIQLPL